MYRILLLLLIFLSIPNALASTEETKIAKITFDKMVEDINGGSYPKIHSVIVANKNKILFEEYFNGHEASKLHDTRSAFKSFTSLLTGIAIDKKIIKSVDEKVVSYFPEYKDIKNWDDRKADITIKHLLTMSSGLKCEEFFDVGPYCEDDMWESKDWVKYSLDLAVSHNPGKHWAYTSSEPMILGGLISNASDKTIMQFAKESLFEPLNITDYKWTIDPEGRGMTAGSFFMKSSDMVKIGQLVLNKGKWKGKQIVSEEWLEESTNATWPLEKFSFTRFSGYRDATPHDTKYGYYWYREKLTTKNIDTEVLFASGNGGQYIMIIEGYDLVVVFNGGNYGNWRGKLPFKLLLKYILPKVAESKKLEA